MKRKLGIVIDFIENYTPCETLKMIKKYGFETFFTGLYDDESLSQISKTAKELDLEFEFIHAPWDYINDMWTADEDPEIFKKIEECILQASKYGVGGVIVHVSSGYYPPKVCDKGFDRYDRLVSLAKEKGVKIGFENLRTIGHLTCVIERYVNEDHVGFCFDSGHSYCYTEKPIPWLDLYGKKTIYTHIHDNMGKTTYTKEDKHLLPFEGIIDFKYIMDKLNEYDYKGSIMIESLEALSQYKGEEFIKEAYIRGQKLLNL